MTKDQEQSEVIHRLVQAIESDADNWSAYVDLVSALTAAHSLPQAEELGLKALARFSDLPVARDELQYALGNVYYQAGDFDRANHFFSTIEAKRLKHDATLMQAQSWYGQRQYKRALAFALTAVQQDPNDVMAQDLLGDLWLSQNDLKRAKQAFEMALLQQVDDFRGNFGRGLIALIEQGLDDNPWLKRAQLRNPERFVQEQEKVDDLLTVLKGGQHGQGS
ncbi:tetratricopeptide repeat protein [Weissella halotolerans]|nr:tetratricopeptide repeat protein [Weissella halotolerans]